MDPDSRPCPVCGETIKVAAVKCRFCGEDLVAWKEKQEAAHERVLFAGRPATLHSIGQWALAILTLGIAALVFWIKRLQVRYEFTTQRLKIERGLLSKTVQNVELYRVDDFTVEKPLGMRMLGFGILHLRSSDRSTGDISIAGLAGPDVLAEELRTCVQRERERLGVRVYADA